MNNILDKSLTGLQLSVLTLSAYFYFIGMVSTDPLGMLGLVYIAFLISPLLLIIGVTGIMVFHKKVPKLALSPFILSIIALPSIFGWYLFSFSDGNLAFYPFIGWFFLLIALLTGIWNLVRKYDFKKEVVPFISSGVLFLFTMNPFTQTKIGSLHYNTWGSFLGMICSIIAIMVTIYFMTLDRHVSNDKKTN